MDSTSSIVLRCSKGTPYTIKLNAETTSGSTVTQRLMAPTTTGNPDILDYNLYTTATHTTIWGDGTSGTVTVTGTGNGVGAAQTITHTVYGQIPAGQDVSPDTYNDTISVTVEF